MVQLNDSENGIIIFAAPSNLHLLCDPAVKILGDGTFKTCPRFFTQLYILHAFKNGVYVPCVFCLLPSKSEDIYHKMFQAVHFMCVQQGLHLDVTSINLDFELATHKAVLKIWPNASIQGCFFHLSQAWYRKINSLGLSVDYQQPDSDVGLWLKRFFGLSFLNPTEVEDCLAFDVMLDAPDDERCVQFSNYILSTYAAPDATFPPTLWANHDLDDVKTTNGCESFHRHFSDLFRSPHPNVFELMANLKDIQAYSTTKLNTIRTGRGAPVLRRQVRLKRDAMATIKRRYAANDISRKQFVSKMAWKNLPAKL
ncbi:uncharacterized protein [Littorina saxatilis]|uniref:uncharacterized protein n=1 Tax=Littorina saxatilis TaxID=31220 RepID=UPI0038B5D697